MYPQGTVPDPNAPAAGPIGFSRFGYRLGEVRFLAVPVDTETDLGQGADFNASVDGAMPYTYQWYKNGVAIPGALGPSYRLAQAVASDDGAEITVTAGNRFSSVTSAPVKLKVRGAVAPSLTIERGEGNSLFVRWPSEATGWVLQANDDLGNPAGWADLNETVGMSSYEVPGEGRKFFRMRNSR
jgi:hypothetical protein